MTPGPEVRPAPCSTCPYRRDVPSGVWHWDEYEKLRLYDEPTYNQPAQGFRCHCSPDSYCHGWAVVHSARGHDRALLALRLHPPSGIPSAAVELFSSGHEAADHGQRDYESPSPAAIVTARRLVDRHPHITG